MVAVVLQRRLLTLAVVLVGAGCDMDMEITLWELVGSLRAWQVVLQYLQILVLTLGGGFPLCCTSGSGYRRILSGPHRCG